MRIFNLRRSNVSSIIYVIYIILLIVLLFSCLKSLKLTSNRIHAKQIENPKLVVVSFSDVINLQVCTSLLSALLMEWEYVLLTKSNITMPIDAKMLKPFNYQKYLNDDADVNSYILFADAFDILFQQSSDSILSFIENNFLLSSKVFFSAEKECYPATHPHPEIYFCPLTQGQEYLDNRSGTIPLLCRMEIDKARQESSSYDSIFLNSGISIGAWKNQKSILEKIFSLMETLPQKCFEDQGIYSWLYVTGNDILLDFRSQHFLSAYLKLESYKFDSSQGLWKDSEGFSPSLIHFNGDKSQLLPMMKTFFDWHQSRSGKINFEEKMKNFQFKLDGKSHNYSQICSKYVNDFLNN